MAPATADRDTVTSNSRKASLIFELYGSSGGVIVNFG
jgi:hypothetical protein